jgi:hypothetical protein
MRGISWLAATTGQLLKKDSAPWSKFLYDKLHHSFIANVNILQREEAKKSTGILAVIFTKFI